MESYLRAQGERFARQCDAERYRLLSESLDLHRIDAKALATPLHLFAVREDRLVPASDIETLALACGATFSSISSLYGHDAFLKETDAVGAWLRVHQENALALVDVLGAHPAVAAVHDPGLSTHPGHALAARQQRGFGAMLSFDLRGGLPAVRAFVDGLRYFTLAESLGGVESLVAHPASMTHAAMSAEARARAGIGDGLLRLSIGIEAAGDLCADLAAALDRAAVIDDRASARG